MTTERLQHALDKMTDYHRPGDDPRPASLRRQPAADRRPVAAPATTPRRPADQSRTITRRHRHLDARRPTPDHSTCPAGRPAIRRRLVVRLGHRNPNCGYRRIHGAFAGLGYPIGASTARKILPQARTGRGLPLVSSACNVLEPRRAQAWATSLPRTAISSPIVASGQASR